MKKVLKMAMGRRERQRKERQEIPDEICSLHHLAQGQLWSCPPDASYFLWHLIKVGGDVRNWSNTRLSDPGWSLQ
jgi:hypothetical protein